MFSTVETTKTKEGIGGLLLLLCLNLTLFLPAVTLFFFYSFLINFEKVFYQSPVLNVIDIVISIGLMGFSVYAGVALWQKKQNAVKLTKYFLLSLIAYNVFSLILPGPGSNYAGSAIGNALIWYAYLMLSDRVRATYKLSS